jgi:hypothetical protein
MDKSSPLEVDSATKSRRKVEVLRFFEYGFPSFPTIPGWLLGCVAPIVEYRHRSRPLIRASPSIEVRTIR